MDMQGDLERLMFFEQARRIAEDTYNKDPLDADNLTRWGGALIELSHFQPVEECKNMIKDAISKLDKALLVNPDKHDALWCMGNANTSLAFVTADRVEAKPYFDQAYENFKKAAEVEPDNELYRKSLEVALKAPEMHEDLHQQIALNQQVASQAVASGPSTSGSARGKKAKSNNSDLKYDICGWIILAVGLVAWVGFAKSQMPPPPPAL